jgi:pyruvate formate lyase activating enzyme
VRVFLERRGRLLDAVVFSGGEPTLQGALPAAMQETRSMGFKVGLHTAGPYPERLRRLLPLLDWVGLDIKALAHEYPMITGVPGSGERAWQSLRLLLKAGVPLQVRTTVLPGWSPTHDLTPLAEAVQAVGVAEHVLQVCRTDSLLDPRVLGEAAPAARQEA